MSDLVDRFTKNLKQEFDLSADKVSRLANLDFFILDNSIRESAVSQLRSHTIEDKKAIYQLSRECGMHSILVASFSQMHRVDDDFCQWLKDTDQDFSKLFSFSEVLGGKIVDGVPDTDRVPVSLQKNKKYGLYNTLFEVDLADPNVAWGTKWTVEDMCKQIQKWMFWVYDNINANARILVNFRDFPIAISEHPERVLSVVEFLSRMPEDIRLFGLAFEDPIGESLPDEIAACTRAVRGVMDGCGWKTGHLLNHFHDKWEMKTSTTLECLAAGSDGVWSSMCVEGAVLGHASSTVTLMNLVRMGNKKVLGTYDCKEFRKAAIAVTNLTTTKRPHPKQCVYGERALDMIFGFLGDFNLAAFFGEKTEFRMTVQAKPQMVVDRLSFLFGSDPQFTLNIGQKMIEKMLEDLSTVPPRKEDYQSAIGLAVLFARCGGHQTTKMNQAIVNLKSNCAHHQRFIDEIRELWDSWNTSENVKRDGAMDIDSFYHGFLSPYLGCYRFIDIKQALKKIGMEQDGYVDWEEFLVYIKWALTEYPNTTTSDEVIEIAFQKGVVHAMCDAKAAYPEMQIGFNHEQGAQYYFGGA